MILITQIFLLTFLFDAAAFAYLDPGSGSFLIQMLVAFLATLTFYFRTLIDFIKSSIQKIKNFLKKKKDK